MGFHITDMQLNVLFQTWQKLLGFDDERIK